ncbi:MULTISPECIES: hypothetical protein [unclassified Nonomuraea]
MSPWFDASIPVRSDDATKVSCTLTFAGSGLVSRVTTAKVSI